MKNRKPWRVLWAALLCLALVCGMFAAVAEEEIVIEDAVEAVEALPADDGLELDGNFDDAVEDLSGLALNDALELNDALTLDEVLLPAEQQPAAGAEGDQVELEPASNDATDDASKIPLAVTYFGPTLTKEYDCTNSIFKQTASGGTTFAITFPKAENFGLAPATGYNWVEGHTDVTIKVTSIQKNADGSSRLFSGSDVGDNYTLNITFGLEGADASYYVAQAVKLPAAILPREVVITPRSGLTKVYGADDPAYKTGSWLSSDETSPLHQDISGLPGYAVPVNTVDGATKLTISNAGYLLKEAELKGTMFFPNDGFLSREPGEAVGKYRITIGDVDFGKNFKVTLNEEYFTITRRPVTDSDITVASISDKTYTGKAIKPTPVVRYNGKKLKLGTDYKLKYSNNKYPGRATVTVTGLGNFKSNRKVTFKIVLKPTAISKLTAGRTQVAVNWNKGSNNSGYQVCYSVNSDFTKATTKTVKGIKNTKLTLTGLKAKTTYYIRVRTYKTVSGKNYYSAWSKAKKVTTKQ